MLLKSKTGISHLQKYTDLIQYFVETPLAAITALGKPLQDLHTCIWAVYPVLPGRSS